MFNIETYVTPILLSYVDKYVRDFKPADAQVSLWGGGVVMHNLVLKADVLQQEVALPFTLVSGRIHELLIQVPWTKIMSEPIVVTIDTIECVLNLRPPAPPDEAPPPESQRRKTQVVEAPPGYMQALVRRIVSNIALRVHHLIVKYVQDDIVLSLNVKHLAVDSAGANWEPSFADIDQNEPMIRRLVRLDDLTLCLDKSDSDGKIRFYQEPLLYRCQLDLRVLTRLISANTRRASSLNIQLRSSKLAWGVTSEQLTLLLRLFRERTVETHPPSPPMKNTNVTPATPLHATTSNTAEPARSESWSEWAWSWLPTWIDREGVEEAPMPPTPTPIHFSAYLDDVSLVFKVMEVEGSSRKRARGVLNMTATHAAIKSSVCSPTTLRFRMGARSLLLKSEGKCLCGHIDIFASKELPTIYLCKPSYENEEETWTWPEEDFSDAKVETAEAVDEEYREPPPESARADSVDHQHEGESRLHEESIQQNKEVVEEVDELWTKMAPILFFEYTHDRTPTNPYTNPYESPPIDFQYSDWDEQCNFKIDVQPMEIRICMGLIHRVGAIKNIFQELPPIAEPELPMRVLTVEECEALSENLPQRRIEMCIKDMRVRMIPWDHSLVDKAAQAPLVLDVEVPTAVVSVTAPLYPHRVCSAACQMPEDVGPLWQGARLHVSGNFTSIQAKICSPTDTQPRPCARIDLRFVTHLLLNKQFFTRRESVIYSYSIRFREMNICGSTARLLAAWYVAMSLWNQRASMPLRLTTLAHDALNDEESVAIDVTLEDMAARGYITNNINTHIISFQTAKATALHALKGAELKQAWLFSAPDAPTTTPYLRLGIQWCTQSVANSLDYICASTEPLAICVDPLLIAWLAYKPQMKPISETLSHIGSSKSMSTSQYFMRRRATPPSSSGRGASRSGSGAELVHVRPRSLGSSSEPSEKKEPKPPPPTVKPPEPWWSGDRLLQLHQRLRHMLVNVELGLLLLYVTTSSASALDCATVRDAMERHAFTRQNVLVLSLGRFSMHSSAMTKNLWHEIRHDGPTILTANDQHAADEDSFPWKLRLADVSCYTLETRVASERSGRDKSGAGLQSRLKCVTATTPRTVLELVSTSITLSVVTKSLQIKTYSKKSDQKKQTEVREEERVKYFTSGVDFKPSSLKEFVRGPARRKKSSPEPVAEVKPEPTGPKYTSGPVVSLGVHLHADTPPIIVRLDQDQVHMVAGALHCFRHILTLLKRPLMPGPRHGFSTIGGSHRSLIRSVSEMEEIQSQSEDTPSENRSELIPIFEARSAQDLVPNAMKTSFWFQWVISRATLVVATTAVKLAFDIDDIISTVDIQSQYNQLKVKLASASVKHYERVGSDEWTPGVLGGRILEAREPTNLKEENHFLAVTITQAQISNLPASWKEELHPKLLEQKFTMDSMWEIYATLAPLEAVIQPTILEHILSVVSEMAPKSYCPLQTEQDHGSASWQWPFCYITAGGLRLLVTCEEENKNADDTFMFVIGKISVNPHPENPICRRAVNAGGESAWLSANGGFDGRQYEILVKNVGIRSAQFRQLVHQQESESEILKGTGGENPALKWSRPVVAPTITPVLHGVDVGCVLAPAFYIGGVLAAGPAVEFNLMSDCSLELSVDQLALIQHITNDMLHALKESRATERRSDDDRHGICPYATLLMNRESADSISILSDTTFVEEEVSKTQPDIGRSLIADSGVDTMTSHSTFKFSRQQDDISLNMKKSMSVGFVENTADSSEYLEIFVTMGMIELSLYIADDGSPEVKALRPPFDAVVTQPEPVVQVVIDEERESSNPHDDRDSVMTKSLTETIRNVEIGKAKMELPSVLPHARKTEGNLALVHVTLHQPNLYYWRKRSQKSFQVSLFNAWVGLGVGMLDGHWHAALLSTAKGVPDPLTDIPPALATMKLITPATAASATSGIRGSLRIDIERPVQFEICSDRLRRLKIIWGLIQNKVPRSSEGLEPKQVELPLAYRIRRAMVQNGIESVTIQTSQVGVSGSEGTGGWDSMSLQVAAGTRPERLIARGLITALLVAAGPPGDRRHVLLHPLMLGLDLEATWEAWRRAEGGMSAREPTIRVVVDFDRITIDLRPSDLATLNRIQQTIEELRDKTEIPPTYSLISTDSVPLLQCPSVKMSYDRRYSGASCDSCEIGDHYYKDDLRSGAFKIVSGGQLPMAYQVMLHGNVVSWKYPHPRAITRIVAFPLPGQDEEIDSVLELYNPMLQRWEAHTYFKLPVGEPRELHLYVAPPDVVFAVMWRFRTCSGKEKERKEPPFEFNFQKFVPKQEPLLTDPPPDTTTPKSTDGVTAEQLSGVLRVDSYFAPQLMPHTRLVVRLTAFELHAHNALPNLSSQATSLEGYYVSRPLMRSHRVLTINTRNTTMQAQLDSPAGIQILLDTLVSADILDCTTGTMERLVDKFRVQSGLSLPGGNFKNPRTRLCASSIHVALNVPCLRTLQSLMTDWNMAVNQYLRDKPPPATEGRHKENYKSKREVAAAIALALEGRVSLWVHNSCASALRMGQEGTDEVVPLGPGARLAYRWRNPTSPKKLRFALAGPSADWHWSHSIPFTTGTNRVRLEDAESLGSSKEVPGAGVFVHVRVEETGARRYLHLAGRLALANMLRFNLLYKVRARCAESNQWRTVCSGELAAESVGRTVICGAECEMVLKIKLVSHDTGWSGDIPLKECPKENVPWLVKVPSEGEVPYVSVWCRVVRGRSDGRILATVWPLYVLRSHLPLDTDVMINTESGPVSAELMSEQKRPPLIQTALGRGTTTHLLAPGTTSARHSLSFQYRNIECPVTRDAVPLHYGVTDTSVFDKRTPVASIDDVIQDIINWLQRSRRGAVSNWPYTLIAKHWPDSWQPALLQPRCDVTVRYQAVRAGGGCCLEILLCPVVLLCNATPIALTLRAHDAAPLCKLEPGAAISPPSAVLKKPFFMSVEMGRETFVSGQLEVCSTEPGRYGEPPSGHVALDHATNFAIQCNQKVALLTMYYEIKEEINILAVTSTYVLINRLKVDLLVSAIAVPEEVERDAVLRPKTFKLVPPTKEGSIHGTPLSRLWLRGRWRGGDPSELRAFLCLALPSDSYPASTPVPIRLGMPPVRRALALTTEDKKSMPIVVMQIKHEGRLLVTVAEDPCPQFVVNNRTRISLAVAQPLHFTDEPSTSNTKASRECAGARWWCTVPPGAVTHYSTPSHCALYPPPPVATPYTLPFLTFARAKEEGEPDWCMPIATADGEQLLQLCGGLTVKLRTRAYPHSTLLDLQHVDHHDISASDIRQRLIGPFSEDSIGVPSVQNVNVKESAPVAHKLTRIGADDRLLDDTIHSVVSLEQDENQDLITLMSEAPSIDINMLEKKSDRNIALQNPNWEETNETREEDKTLKVIIAKKTSFSAKKIVIDPFSGTTKNLESEQNEESEPKIRSKHSELASDSSYIFNEPVSEWNDGPWSGTERVRCVIEGVAITVAGATDVSPLFALHIDRPAALILADVKKTRTILSIADIQIDNLQYESGQYDFAVVATTRAEPLASDHWPPLWNMFAEKNTFAMRHDDARVLLKVQHDKWSAVTYNYKEVTEVEVHVGPLALYVEDAYVTAVVELSQLVFPASVGSDAAAVLAEERSLQRPLRLRALHIHPLDLTLTLHTAVRMYIALDQSPLRLSAFKLQHMMTSVERLTHALTVHYLSAAILGAGWVVGGLELLGAPGALAARVGGATGGVRGVASAAAAALLRSLSAWAGSLARNLDLLAGDEEHARRAAAARRRPPPSLVAGLVAGITNFAINILGAVGGLAHHPLVGVAVGETESGAAALRRGLLGAITKPLSATADLVAYAGHGLLRQTGWDPVPQPRESWSSAESQRGVGWRRDCVRWTFRLAELTALAGFEVLLDGAPLQLLFTHKFLVVADPETERIVEMIDFRFCSLGPYEGQIIELCVTQKRQSKMIESRAIDEDDEYQISAAAMARVARYTGAEGTGTAESRVLSLLPPPGRSHALYAALAAALHHNADSHFPLL